MDDAAGFFRQFVLSLSGSAPALYRMQPRGDEGASDLLQERNYWESRLDHLVTRQQRFPDGI